MSASSGFAVQGRVLYALMMREVHTLYGNTTIGYLWALIQCLAYVMMFWLFRYYTGFRTTQGMSLCAFLLSGFLPYNIFRSTMSKCLTAVSGNLSLLTYAQVTNLDLMVSRMIVCWATEILAGVLVYIAAIFLNEQIFITHLGYFFLALVLAPLFGLSTGCLIVTIGHYWSPIFRIMPIFNQMLFWTSGLFFSISSIPRPYQDYLLYNPVAQLVELTRLSVSSSSINSKLDLPYLLMWVFISLVFALLFERYLRGRTSND